MRKLLGAVLALLSAAAFGTTLNPIQLLNPAGSTSGQAIVSTGASSAPAWSSVSATALAAQAANTVVANVTGSSASPTAFAMPSCSASGSALQWTSGTGFNCVAGYASLNTPNFTAPVTITENRTSANNTLTVTANSDTAGANILMIGNGATTPDKYVRVINGAFQILNNAYTTTLMSMDDSGNVTFNGTVTPTGGTVGSTTGSAAATGNVGQVICAQVTNGGSPTGCATNSNTPVSLTTAIAANITSISLTAGDWDVWGNVVFLAAGSTLTQAVQCSFSQTSATQASTPNQGGFALLWTGSSAGSSNILPCGMMPIHVSSTTTLYLVGQANFTTSTMTAYGYIGARRRD